jgi:hypothetical protein
MDEIKKRDWTGSRFGPPVRVTKESHEWLKEKKGKKSMAGFLEYIINKYKKDNNK